MPGNETPDSVSCVTGLSQHRSGASTAGRHLCSRLTGTETPTSPPCYAPASAGYSQGDISHPALHLDGTWGHRSPFRYSQDRDTPPRHMQTDGWVCRLPENKRLPHLQGKHAARVPPVCPAAPHLSLGSGRTARDNPTATLPPVSTAEEERGIFTKKTMSHYLPVSNMPLKLVLHRNPHSDKGSDLEEGERRGEKILS